MRRKNQSILWSVVSVWLIALFCNVVQAAAPDWHAVNYPFYTGVMARVMINGVPIRSAGSKLAAFYGDELRGVADILGAIPEENLDGEYYFNLMFGSETANETGFTFKLWDSTDDKIYNLDKTLDFDVNYPISPETYGGFTAGGDFVPCIMNVNIGPVPRNLTVSGGKINGTSATSGQFLPGEEVTITATLPSGKGLKIWTPSGEVQFIGSILGGTTTFIMPDEDISITASFITKSEMAAVSVRSTTNSGDDIAKEPSSTTAVADKGKFTFTRTITTNALTVYYSLRGMAENGDDYKTLSDSVNFAKGASSVSIDVEPLYDGIDEEDETVEVILEPAPGTQTYRGGTYTDATVIIQDTRPIPVDTYTVTVVNGTINDPTAVSTIAEFAAGEQVAIKANNPPDGKVFDKWTSNGNVAFANETAAETTFEMPSANVTVTATYKDALPTPVGPFTLTVSGGKINGTSATTGQFYPGDEITIAATLPTNKGLKIWTPSKAVEFSGSVLGATTTIIMPAYDVTVTASFITKSEMQAVAVRSTTNAGDDTAQEPTSATATADKGKFTFTRTSSSGALTVYYSVRGTATNGVDYKSILGSISFGSGKTSVTCDIEPLYDGIDESDETVTVVLEPAPGTQTYRGGTVTDATVIIKDTPGPTPVDTYTVTVVNGTSDKAVAASGETVAITADNPPTGKVFDRWTSDSNVVFADETTSETTFEMVASDVTVTATYKDAPPTPVGPFTLTVSGGKIDGTTSSTGQFNPGEEVVITATLPTNQGLKIWTPSKAVEFIGSVLGATTTIKMPAYDVTVTASFIVKSSMQAVAVRSTTNAGDDIATEPTSATATADKGKFTFTRTSSSGALTVYYSVRGTATNGVDYKSIPGSISFGSGKTSVTCDIEPLYDELLEGDETVTVVLEPAPGTQTYRGGAVTDATVIIKEPVQPTVQYTLSASDGSDINAAGAKWKIDDGDWNNSGETVASTVGTHTISFEAVSGYNTPASQTITLASGENKVGTAVYSTGRPTLTIVNGKINGTSATSAQFLPGEIVTITATVPSTSQALKIWTPNSDVEFIGSILGATTTIKMPAHDVTITASFVAKSSMPAVAVRSTTDGGDTAQEPSSTTATASNGKFTFTRTTTSGALTVYFDVRGTATEGTDYRTLSRSVTFASGKDSVTLPVEPLFDGVTEGDEMVQVVLIPPNGTQNYRGGTVTDATVIIKDSEPAPLFHPADCITQDYIISGVEYLTYIGPVKLAALANYEVEWDGTDVLSLTRKSTRGGDVAQTRGDGVAIVRTVTPAVFTAGSTVEVTLIISGADKMTNLFIGEKIPEGWTVLGNAASNVIDGILRMAWDAPDIPNTFTYTIKAPTANLADSYVITSSPQDTACFTDVLELIPVADTALLNNANNYHYHPADCVNKDNRISGVEYLAYAGPVKALALANEEYTWDGIDVMSIRRKNATRGGVSDDVAIARSVNTTTYEANNRIIVTLTITGAENMVSLFVGERIPDGWTVAGDYSDNVRNGVLRMTWDAPNIPDTVTYTLQAPAKNLAPICRIATSSVDTGCFTDRVVFLKAEDTVLTWDTDQKPAEWPQDMKLYTPANGKNYRSADKLAVTFSWPAILNADGYRLVVATYDGAIVFDETVAETYCSIGGLECGSFVWNVTAVGDGCVAGTSDDMLFAIVPDSPAPIITGAVADGTTVRLSFDTADASYRDGAFAFQMAFFSLKTNSWTSLTQDLQVANGRAVIDLGVEVSNGYLYISPVTTPESDFVELFIK